MKDSTIIAILLILLVLNVFKTPKIEQKGYTQKELDYLLEIQKLKIERSNLLDKIYNNEKAIKKDSAFVYSATWRQRDSLRSALNPR